MKRYDSISSRNAYPDNDLVDVSSAEKFEESTNKPLYANPSVVDDTYFKPGVPDCLQSFGSTRMPLFDSDSSGTIPDSAVSLAYIRSPARDRTEIDFALEVVKSAVEKAKKEDESNIKDIQKSEKALESIKKVITESISESKVSDSETK